MEPTVLIKQPVCHWYVWSDPTQQLIHGFQCSVEPLRSNYACMSQLTPDQCGAQSSVEQKKNKNLQLSIYNVRSQNFPFFSILV